MATNGKTIVPPQNLEAEESVLGAMLVAESTIEPVLLDVRLQADDFYRDRHRTIYEAIIRLNEDANPVDVLTVSDAELVVAMRLFATRMKMVVEPTGCLGLAAVQKLAAQSADQRVGVIVSGGNVDLDRFAALLAH